MAVATDRGMEEEEDPLTLLVEFLISDEFLSNANLLRQGPIPEIVRNSPNSNYQSS